jgi:hypothetical protein
VCISHYFEAYREKLPSLWFHEHEGLERVRVDYPIPGSLPCAATAWAKTSE